ncbi:MAG: hypothetical protein IPG07_19805 [Crocinitomicaceae bacterium]|nr:hypothetical protein [Crocinitomicaceae bacterium]
MMDVFYLRRIMDWFFQRYNFSANVFQKHKNLQTGKVYDVYVAADSSVWFTVLNNTVLSFAGDSVRVIGRWQEFMITMSPLFREGFPASFGLVPGTLVCQD